MVIFFLDSPKSTNTELETIIFFDPPYNDDRLYKKVFEIVSQKDFKGELWVEYDITSSKETSNKIEKLFADFGLKRYRHASMRWSC